MRLRPAGGVTLYGMVKLVRNDDVAFSPGLDGDRSRIIDPLDRKSGRAYVWLASGRRGEG